MHPFQSSKVCQTHLEAESLAVKLPEAVLLVLVRSKVGHAVSWKRKGIRELLCSREVETPVWRWKGCLREERVE